MDEEKSTLTTLMEDLGLDFEKDMAIEESALDVEWLNQPVLALKYCRLLTKMRASKAHYDLLLKNLRTQYTLEVLKDPEGCCGKAKPTVNDIDAYVRSQSEYLDVEAGEISLKNDLAYVEVAFREMVGTRKEALENLVKLFGMNYFAGPQSPRDIGNEAQVRRVQQEKADKGVSQGLKKKKKRRKKTEPVEDE